MEQQIGILEAIRNQDTIREHNETAQNITNQKSLGGQQAQILSILQRGESLTGLDALERVGTMKLASRVSELRRAGFDIKDETICDPNTRKHYKRYFL